LSEPDKFSPDSYDLSEAALKELYRDFDADDPNDVSALIDKASVLIGADLKDRIEPKKTVAPSVSDVAARTPPVEPPARVAQNIRAKASPRPKLGPRLASIVVVLAFLAPLGWVFLRPTAVRQPTIKGFLGVADLAAGRTIRPGETYGVDIPSDQVRIEVLSGRVALVARSGAALRGCSDQPFDVEVKHGAATSAGPLVVSCGGGPSLIRAAMPQLPLPVPAHLPGEGSGAD
jgi:hypothetical protein